MRLIVCRCFTWCAVRPASSGTTSTSCAWNRPRRATRLSFRPISRHQSTAICSTSPNSQPLQPRRHQTMPWHSREARLTLKLRNRRCSTTRCSVLPYYDFSVRRRSNKTKLIRHFIFWSVLVRLGLELADCGRLIFSLPSGHVSCLWYSLINFVNFRSCNTKRDSCDDRYSDAFVLLCILYEIERRVVV